VDQARLLAEQQAVDGGVVLTLGGEIDVSTTGMLADALSRAAGVALVVVADLAAVTFLDSTGINTLLRAHHDLVADGGRLALTDPQPPVLRVLDITGVDRVIPVYPSVGQALRP
jgi:anti-anti-sigma factor